MVALQQNLEPYILTKSNTFKAVVLRGLLHAVDIWPIKQWELHSFELFHHQYLNHLECFYREQQIAQHIMRSNVHVCSTIGMLVPLSNIISSCRFHWLGYGFSATVVSLGMKLYSQPIVSATQNILYVMYSRNILWLMLSFLMK